MSIHLARDGSALGIFTEAEVRDGLASGRFRRDDLGWREGMPAWTALATWPEFAEATPVSGGFAPELPAGPAMPAWERGASFANFFATIRDVAIDPVRTFDALPREGVRKPLGFNYLGVLPGWLCGTALYALVFSVIGVGQAALGESADALTPGLAAIGAAGMTGLIAVAFACMLCLFPLMHFVGAGTTHLLLLPWSPQGGYIQTYRSTAYAQGAFLPFIFVPCLNYVVGPWMMVASVIALSRVHRIEWWKVVISTVVVPCLFICCLFAVALMLGAFAGLHG